MYTAVVHRCRIDRLWTALVLSPHAHGYRNEAACVALVIVTAGRNQHQSCEGRRKAAQHVPAKRVQANETNDSRGCAILVHDVLLQDAQQGRPSRHEGIKAFKTLER